MAWRVLAATDPEGLYGFLDKGGVLGLLCLVIFVIVVGGMREWYYLRPYVKLLLERISERDTRLAEKDHQIENITEDRDAWRDTAQGAVGTAEKAAARPHRRPTGEGRQ